MTGRYKATIHFQCKHTQLTQYTSSERERKHYILYHLVVDDVGGVAGDYKADTQDVRVQSGCY